MPDKFKPGDLVHYIHIYGPNCLELRGVIVGPGLREGTWRVWLEDHRLTVTAKEIDIKLLLGND
jgi:hypothetical protein